MRVYYPDGFLGPPVLNLDPQAVTHLFAEMDQIAAKLRAHPQFVQDDLQFAFCKLQRKRIGNLSRDAWLWLFEIWCDHDRGQQVIDAAKRDARFDALCKQREALFAERAAAPPQQHASLTARLLEIGRELAELQVQQCRT